MPGADSAILISKNGNSEGIQTNSGQQLVITNRTDSTVLAEIKNPGFKKGICGWNFIAAAGPNTITVQWYMDFHLRWYPWEKFSSLLLEKRYGPMMEQGLARLKNYFEVR